MNDNIYINIIVLGIITALFVFVKIVRRHEKWHVYNALSIILGFLTPAFGFLFVQGFYDYVNIIYIDWILELFSILAWGLFGDGMIVYMNSLPPVGGGVPNPPGGGGPNPSGGGGPNPSGSSNIMPTSDGNESIKSKGFWSLFHDDFQSSSSGPAVSNNEDTRVKKTKMSMSFITGEKESTPVNDPQEFGSTARIANPGASTQADTANSDQQKVGITAGTGEEQPVTGMGGQDKKFDSTSATRSTESTNGPIKKYLPYMRDLKFPGVYTTETAIVTIGGRGVGKYYGITNIVINHDENPKVFAENVKKALSSIFKEGQDIHRDMVDEHVYKMIQDARSWGAIKSNPYGNKVKWNPELNNDITAANEIK